MSCQKKILYRNPKRQAISSFYLDLKQNEFSIFLSKQKNQEEQVFNFKSKNQFNKGKLYNLSALSKLIRNKNRKAKKLESDFLS